MSIEMSPTTNVFVTLYTRAVDAVTGMPGARTLSQENLAGYFVDYTLALDRMAANPDDRSQSYHLHVPTAALSVGIGSLAGLQLVVTHEKGLSGLYIAKTDAEKAAATFEIQKAIPASSDGRRLILTLARGTGVV